jgi:ribosomal protein S18 acetylase RimI-like enzyme
MMHSIEIIQLTPDDWQVYRALRLEALRTEPQAFGSDYASNLQRSESSWRERLEESEAGEKGWIRFARRGDQLVGMLGGYVSEDDPAVVDVISMYVQPAHRGQGISKQLMSALLHTLSQHSQFERARLTVNIKQTAALKLYTSFGFEIIRTENALMGDGQYHDEHIMEKRLR